MDGEELIEYLEDRDNPQFHPENPSATDGELNFNSNLASLIPTKDNYLLDNMTVYDVMVRQDRIHDSHTINPLKDKWTNTVNIVEEAKNSDEKEVYTIKGFKQHFMNSSGSNGGYQPETDVIETVSQFFESNTTQVSILDYPMREKSQEFYESVDENDKKIASACADLDASWVTFDNDALAYRTDIEVATPKRALEVWK